MSEQIRCRARLSDADCYDGSSVERQIPREDEEHQPLMSDDGTFDGDSIVCDPCYVRLMAFTRSGMALNDELDEAIDAYRRNLAWVQAHDDVGALVAQAESFAANARPGSLRHRSAMACKAMAEREMQRRALA